MKQVTNETILNNINEKYYETICGDIWAQNYTDIQKVRNIISKDSIYAMANLFLLVAEKKLIVIKAYYESEDECDANGVEIVGVYEDLKDLTKRKLMKLLDNYTY